MAIKTEKLFPIVKSSTAIVKSAGSEISAEKKQKGGRLIQQKKLNIQKFIPPQKKEEEKKENYGAIIKSLVSIDSILKSDSKLEKKTFEKDRIEKEKEESEKKEKKLEAKEKPKGIKLPSISLPKLDFLDSIKRYFFFTFLGWLFTNIQQFLPKLLKILDIIKPVVSFAEFIFKGLLDGFIAFVDLGYKAYDTVRNTIKNLGGEGAQQVFDELSKNLNTLVTTTILVAGAIAALGERSKTPDVPQGPDKPRGPKGGTPRGPRRSPITGKLVPTTSGGRTAGRPDLRNPFRQKPAITGSGGGRSGRPDLRNPFRQKPTITGSGGKNIPRLPAGKKLGLGKVALRGAPVIGPLIDFGIRTLIFKESPGRAAAGAIGAGVGQALGGALAGTIGGIVGSVVPFVGTLLVGSAGAFVGQLIGGFIGDWIGTSLYDAVSAMRGKKKVEKKEKGGKVSPKIRSKKTKQKRTLKVAPKKPQKRVPQTTKPGKDVGGEKKIIDLYSKEIKESDKFKRPLGGWLSTLFSFAGGIGGIKKDKDTSAFDNLIKNSKALKEIPFVGRFLGAGLDAGALGQAPDKNLVKGFAEELNYFIQLQTQQQVSQGLVSIKQAISTMAEGGTVPERSLKISQMDITNDIENSLSGMINQRVGEVIRNFSGALRGPTGRDEMLEDNQRRAREAAERQRSGGGGSRGGGGGLSPEASGAEDVTADTKEEKAWLRTLRKVEGTSGAGGYGKVFGGRIIKELEDGKLTIEEAAKMSETGRLPSRLGGRQIAYGSYRGRISGATGAYQFMPSTLRAAARRAGIDLNTPMTPEIQDKLAIAHLKAIGIDPSKAATEATIRKAGGSAGWAGVHGEATGQTSRTVADSLRIYNEFLKREKDDVPVSLPQIFGVEKDQQASMRDVSSGRYGRFTNNRLDTDGHQTGRDIELFGNQGMIPKKYDVDSRQGPYGNRGVEISFPFELIYYDKVPKGFKMAGQSSMQVDTTQRWYKGTAPRSSFGISGSYYYRDPRDGKLYQIFMGHGNKPFKKFKDGQKIPAGTVVGFQGASGTSDDSAGGAFDHISFHVNSQDGNITNAQRVFDMAVSSLLTGAGARITAAAREKEKREKEKKDKQTKLRGTPSQQRIISALSKKGSIPIMVDGKKFFFMVDKDGTTKAFRTKNIFGYQEPVDISKNKNQAIRHAITMKVNSMYKTAENPQPMLPTSTSKPLGTGRINAGTGGRPSTLSQIRSLGITPTRESRSRVTPTQSKPKPSKPKRAWYDPRGWVGMQGGGSVDMERPKSNLPVPNKFASYEDYGQQSTHIVFIPVPSDPVYVPVPTKSGGGLRFPSSLNSYTPGNHSKSLSRG